MNLNSLGHCIWYTQLSVSVTVIETLVTRVNAYVCTKEIYWPQWASNPVLPGSEPTTLPMSYPGAIIFPTIICQFCQCVLCTLTNWSPRNVNSGVCEIVLCAYRFCQYLLYQHLCNMSLSGMFPHHEGVGRSKSFQRMTYYHVFKIILQRIYKTVSCFRLRTIFHTQLPNTKVTITFKTVNILGILGPRNPISATYMYTSLVIYTVKTFCYIKIL